MTSTPAARATRRYLAVLFPAMAIFFASSLAISRLEDVFTPSPSVLYVTAIIPIAAILCTFWALYRYIFEVDEFLRMIQIKGLLFGLVSIMVIASGWGYLESYANASPLPVFWLNPIFWIFYALSVAILTARDGGLQQ